MNLYKENKINFYNSPNLNNRHIRLCNLNSFNRTSRINNKELDHNKNNICLKLPNEYRNDKKNFVYEKIRHENIFDKDKEERNKNIFKIFSYEGFKNKDDKIKNNNYDNEYLNSPRSNKSDEEGEPDPRINFEQIRQINKSRPLTSYGGINARRKNLQSALQKKGINRPITSYNKTHE